MKPAPKDLYGYHALEEQEIIGLYDHIGHQVRIWRESLMMTQDELSSRAGVSRSSLANLEAGRQRPPLHVLLGIAKALGIQFSNLLEETEY